MTGTVGSIRRAVALTASLALIGAPTLAQAHEHGHGGGGWGHHGDGIDAGDIFAGLLIMGGIAAIAGAISQRNAEQRDEPQPVPDKYREFPNEGDVGGGEAPNGWRSGAHPSSLDQAVEMCADEAQNRGDVDQIWDAGPMDGGFVVRGNLVSGDSFTCKVDSAGRIAQMAVGSQQTTVAPAQ